MLCDAFVAHLPNWLAFVGAELFGCFLFFGRSSVARLFLVVGWAWLLASSSCDFLFSCVFFLFLF